jgi:6-phosphogluconate dehydrogenase
MVYILMGVSGSGKTTIGLILSKQIKLEFYDADDFHSNENLIKMKNNIALNDTDRELWLDNISKNIVLYNINGGAILACSALKEKYREKLSSYKTEEVTFIYLKVSKKIVKNNLINRKEHFFSSILLNSQYQILEEPSDAITILADNKPEDICKELLKKINLMENRYAK